MSKQNANDHLANERTLLAWVRTSIGIMAFGFVVVKFSIFVGAGELMFNAAYKLPNSGHSGPIGIVIVATGSLSLLLSTLRYRTNQKNIETGNYHHSSILLYCIVSFIILVSIALIIYLIGSV